MPIYKIDKKKNDLQGYRVRISYMDTNGKHQQVERTVYGKGQAQLVEQQLILEYRQEKNVPSSRMTVEELFNMYSEYHAAETRRSTHETAMKRLRLWVLPYFKNKRLDKLTQRDFANWKVKISNENLLLSTKQNIFKTFSAMMNFAVKTELVPKNGLKSLGNFKDSNALESPSETLRYYTASQFEQFISVAKADCKTVNDWNFYTFFSIAFFTGARKGEIHALRWSDIEGNILHIRRSITQKLKTGDLESAPKNKSSIRDLQLPAPLITVLNEHKQRQKEAAKDLFSEDFRICGNGETPLRDTSVDKRNRKYAEAAGLPRITIHEYRHSHVSVLVNAGINIMEISRRLGHSNVEETWNRYAHLYPKEEEKAVEVLNEINIG